MNKLGFGFLRLPVTDPKDNKSIDYPLLNEMVDVFLEHGGKYFDTAYIYLDGESERALRKSLVERHPRDSYEIANKLPVKLLKGKGECQGYFDEQLERCGVTYFDTYLLHWLNEKHYKMAEEYEAFAFVENLKQEGKAKRIGFSYHDTAELLDRILTAHPEMEVVQLQLNYADWDSDAIQARQCYEVAVKHGKKVIVMEPVKGGALAKLPAEAEAVLKEAAPECSIPSWAIRFAGTPEEVETVLSGMNTMEQLYDNMQAEMSLNEAEQKALARVIQILESEQAIACTGCNYCAPNCPMNIPIPQYFKLFNDMMRDKKHDWKFVPAYEQLNQTKGTPADCVQCRECEANCPQKLPISQHLEQIVQEFAKL